jgi:hypothetical protein
MDIQSQINPLIAGVSEVKTMLQAQNIAAKTYQDAADKKFEFFYKEVTDMKKDHQDLKDDVSTYRNVGATIYGLLVLAGSYIGLAHRK